MSQHPSVIAVEPKSWSVEVDGKATGSVACYGPVLGPIRWLALHGIASTNIGTFDTKDEAIAAVLAYTPPEICPTCGQVVA